MPSRPILQAWAKTVGPSPSMVFVEADAGAGLGHDRRERGFADLKRIAPQVIAVQFDQIEGVQENAFVMAAVADAIERSDAVVITGNRLPIDDAGARAQASQRLDDQREPTGEIVARIASVMTRPLWEVLGRLADLET
jgi:hypothetical protein